MARIAGVDIPDEKVIVASLTYIFGIGQTSSKKILAKANVEPLKRTTELTPEEISRIRSVLEADYKVEGELRTQTFQNIKRLKEIKCYRGIRHKVGLPVRGQRTRCNAHTRKGKSIAVGGLKRVLTKT